MKKLFVHSCPAVIFLLSLYNVTLHFVLKDFHNMVEAYPNRGGKKKKKKRTKKVRGEKENHQFLLCTPAFLLLMERLHYFTECAAVIGK